MESLDPWVESSSLCLETGYELFEPYQILGLIRFYKVFQYMLQLEAHFQIDLLGRSHRPPGQGAALKYPRLRSVLRVGEHFYIYHLGRSNWDSGRGAG